MRLSCKGVSNTLCTLGWYILDWSTSFLEMHKQRIRADKGWLRKGVQFPRYLILEPPAGVSVRYGETNCPACGKPTGGLLSIPFRFKNAKVEGYFCMSTNCVRVAERLYN